MTSSSDGDVPEENRLYRPLRTPAMDIVRALSAEDGLTCVVGAGGKKTTLYALARRLDRAVLTTTVRIPPFEHAVERVVVTEDPIAALADHRDEWPLGLVAADEGDRYTGYDPETVDELASVHDGPVLVKADGARTRDFKAPNDREPQLPTTADVVVPIASVAAVGRPLDEETVHRPERVRALTGLERGETVTPETVATVLSHPDGGLKSVPDGATVVPVLNKVDDPAAEDVGRTVAEAFFGRLSSGENGPSGSTPLAATGVDEVEIPRVILARMIDPRIVACVEPSDRWKI